MAAYLDTLDAAARLLRRQAIRGEENYRAPPHRFEDNRIEVLAAALIRRMLHSLAEGGLYDGASKHFRLPE